MNDEESSQLSSVMNVTNFQFVENMFELDSYVQKLRYEIIFNTNVDPAIEKSKPGPKRYQSEVIPWTSNNSKLPKILKEILGNVSKIAKQINPLFEMFEPRILKCDPKCEGGPDGDIP